MATVIYDTLGNFFLFSFKKNMSWMMEKMSTIINSVMKKERISMTEESGACMNCYLMEIGEVDPQMGRCEKCGKRAANPLLSIS